MSVSGRALLAGVIGDPVGHSLSPRIHTHWLRTLKIDGAYVPLPVPRELFSTAIRGLQAAGFAGLNVTVPHKEAAFAIADRLDEAARAAGAVNLLLFHNGAIEGRNTDVAGLAASLTESLGVGGLKSKTAVVLGAGGAARAALLALAGLGISEVRLVARNESRRDALVRSLGNSIASKVRVFAWSDWPGVASESSLLVNATSAGMQGSSALDLSLEPLPREAVVCDIVYNPLETELLRDAHERGHRTIDGLGMLMHQAAPAFEALFGGKPKVTPELRAELEEALRGRS
jgi:shikimate dehydrogenase